jgi:hypothetical protein
LTLPSTDFGSSITALQITNGRITTPSNHGMTLNQPINITDFTDDAITGLGIGIYFVKTIPQPTQFTLAVTAGGTVITSTGNGIALETVPRQTALISATASAADVQAALQSLDSIGAGGVIVTGIQGEYFDIAFSGAKGYADQPALTIQNVTTAKLGKTANVNFSTFALRDLLGNSTAVDLDLELELTESGTRQTVILQSCSVAEELIDADSFSPVPQFNLPINTVATTSYTLALSDSGSLINAVTGVNILVPTNSAAPFPIGTQILIYRNTSGTVIVNNDSPAEVFAAGGSDAGFELASTYSVSALLKISENSWVGAGDIIPQ